MARIIVNFAVIVSGFSLIALKEITVIQKLAVLGVSAVFINTLIIIYAFIYGFERSEPSVSYPGLWSNNFSQVKFVNYENVFSLSTHVQALASILFCYVNHQLVFPASQNLTNPS